MMEAIGASSLVVSRIRPPASGRVPGRVRYGIEIMPEGPFEAFKCSSVSSPVVADGLGEGVEELPCLDGEAGLSEPFSLGCGFGGWSLHQSSLIGPLYPLYTPLLQYQTF